uniref:Uncharacterized protein n=1 Tax=Solanum lycopersicum TaxID=4081 RepID=A0A3Q7I5K2_SOLLC
MNDRSVTFIAFGSYSEISNRVDWSRIVEMWEAIFVGDKETKNQRKGWRKTSVAKTNLKGRERH